jgi:hypothetical protein
MKREKYCEKEKNIHPLILNHVFPRYEAIFVRKVGSVITRLQAR